MGALALCISLLAHEETESQSCSVHLFVYPTQAAYDMEKVNQVRTDVSTSSTFSFPCFKSSSAKQK